MGYEAKEDGREATFAGVPAFLVNTDIAPLVPEDLGRPPKA